MKKPLVIIVSLILFSFIAIFYRFNQIPKNLAFDEAQFTRLALSLDAKPYTPYSPLATGHATLYFYLLLLSFKIFGVTNFALRLPSAFFGTMLTVFFYLIMSRVFKKNTTAYFATILLLTSHWYLNFARYSFEATFLLFLELASVYFVFKKKFFLSGVFAGLAFNSYTPGRIFFILPLIYLFFNSTTRKLIAFFIPFLIIITPLTAYLLAHKDSRIEQQFFLKNSELSIQKKAEFLWNNIQSTTLMLTFKGDMNGRHNYPGKPALNPILEGLLLLGLLSVFKNRKDGFDLFFAFYFILSIVPAILTYPWENPNMLRTYTALPSLIYFMGRAITTLSRRTWGFVFVIFLIFGSSLYEMRTYFKYQAKVFEQSFELKTPLPDALDELKRYEKH